MWQIRDKEFIRRAEKLLDRNIASVNEAYKVLDESDHQTADIYEDIDKMSKIVAWSKLVKKAAVAAVKAGSQDELCLGHAAATSAPRPAEFK